MSFSKARSTLMLASSVTVFLALLGASATASTITFEHRGSGDGTLAGTPFPTKDFIITALGDTANRQSITGGWFIDHTSASISISGLGIFNILTPTRTFVSNAGVLVGFSRAGADGLDLFNGPSNAAFGSWDMLSSLGPLSGPSGRLQWDRDPFINTTGGILIFTNGACDGIFTATIPEPATFALLAALGALRIRRK